MDNLTILQMAENCCPALFRKFLGVASADNFFSDQNLAQIQEIEVKTKPSFSYQIVNSAAQYQEGQHWLLFAYITIPSPNRKTRVKYGRDVLIFVWDPLGEPMTKYKTIHKRLGRLLRSKIKTFEIQYPLQNPTSNLCGLYCLFMAHYLYQVGLANKVYMSHGRKQKFL